MKEVTRKMVAEEAGVAESTVSLVVNNKPCVSATIWAIVQEVVHRLGYHPHKGAQELVSGRVNTVGVAIPSEYHVFSDPYLSEVMNGISDTVLSYK